MNPMQNISVHYTALSNGERQTCDLVLKNPKIIISNPIAEAAKLYGVSSSSLLRLSQKIGYKGYSEFRFAMESYEKEKSKNSHSNALYSQIIQTYVEALNEIRERLDEENVRSLAKLIHAKDVFTVGMGNSSLPAKQLVYALYLQNKWSECIEDETKKDFLENTVSSHHLIIIFSVSGNNDTYVESIREWKKKGAVIAVVTTNPDAPINKLAAMTFMLPSISMAARGSELYYLDNRSLFFVFDDILVSYYSKLSR